MIVNPKRPKKSAEGKAGKKSSLGAAEKAGSSSSLTGLWLPCLISFTIIVNFYLLYHEIVDMQPVRIIAKPIMHQDHISNAISAAADAASAVQSYYLRSDSSSGGGGTGGLLSALGMPHADGGGNHPVLPIPAPFVPRTTYAVPSCTYCNDSAKEGWCDVPMPSRSHFGFDPPTDTERWRNAACVAASGENVLLKRLYFEFFKPPPKASRDGSSKASGGVGSHPEPAAAAAIASFSSQNPSGGSNEYGFLDGDQLFRTWQPMADVFMHKESSFNAVLRRLEDEAGPAADADTGAAATTPRHTPQVHGKYGNYSVLLGMLAEDEVAMDEATRVAIRSKIPPPSTLYRRRKARGAGADKISTKVNKYTGRYPVLSFGYPFLKRGESPKESPASSAGFGHHINSISNIHQSAGPIPSMYFQGEDDGGYYIGKIKAIRMWQLNKENIAVPFVAMYLNNDNWGFLSTEFPNRTRDWDHETAGFTRDMYEFLDHPMTIALVINQHHNFSHPKIINVPLGLPPVDMGGVNVVSKIVFDAMEHTVQMDARIKHMVYAVFSDWGPRSRIMQCIKENFRAGHASEIVQLTAQPGKWGEAGSSRLEYYRTMARSRFSFGFPGVGYDSFRNWESLSLGAVLVAEKGVGMDRMYWRLPVLLVEDFHDVTPQLLRSAYVEAVYRTTEFQFEKLKQDFWFDLVRNITHPSATAVRNKDRVPKRVSQGGGGGAWSETLHGVGGALRGVTGHLIGDAEESERGGAPLDTADVDALYGGYDAASNSAGRSSLSIVEKHLPMRAEDPDFARPKHLGYTGGAHTQQNEARCARYDAGLKGALGQCKRFPQQTC